MPQIAGELCSPGPTGKTTYVDFSCGFSNACVLGMGDSKTTPPAKVEKELQRLLSDYQQKDSISFGDIVEFHFQFEKIHPFQDGNGRVGRLIIFKECLKYRIIPFMIEERHKWYYYRGLKEFENERGYLMDTCLAAQDAYQELLNYFIEK